mmetsp:Transcript_27488/g.53614  ORF Transcript_27488/g.53614 Transcript_27488/m.53614 type:complete len:218 (-) Transcript_27488:854-1507(-)
MTTPRSADTRLEHLVPPCRPLHQHCDVAEKSICTASTFAMHSNPSSHCTRVCGGSIHTGSQVLPRPRHVILSVIIGVAISPLLSAHLASPKVTNTGVVCPPRLVHRPDPSGMVLRGTGPPMSQDLIMKEMVVDRAALGSTGSTALILALNRVFFVYARFAGIPPDNRKNSGGTVTIPSVVTTATPSPPYKYCTLVAPSSSTAVMGKLTFSSISMCGT